MSDDANVYLIVGNPERGYTETCNGHHGTGSNPSAALQQLHLKFWNRKWAKDAERKAAFKSMKRHFRRSIRYPMWAPRFLWNSGQRFAAKLHNDLVMQVARELDERPVRATWTEAARIINERWTYGPDHPQP
jgi:hypothetical protein